MFESKSTSWFSEGKMNHRHGVVVKISFRLSVSLAIKTKTRLVQSVVVQLAWPSICGGNNNVVNKL